jgi:hydroxyacylglutathione hydrolase
MTKISLDTFKQQLQNLSNDEVVIDVRSSAECSTGKIAEAQNIPLDVLHKHADRLKQYTKVYCICASGNRSSKAQQLLTELGIQSTSVDGGMNMWEQSGLPVEKTSKNIPIMRQVLIVAGSLVLIGTLLASIVSAWWLLLTGFVGVGLVFAGITGICTMSTILGYMPWNRVKNNSQNCQSNTCCTIQKTSNELKNSPTQTWQEKSYSITQCNNPDLAHYSYAVLSKNSIALVDPKRNYEEYEVFAKEHNANIVAIIETHPHADFISGHKEIAKRTGAKIYVHSLVGAEYEHTAFDHNQTITIGDIILRSLHTPGHSPDSICIQLEEGGIAKELFSGDTLFVGDVGRPDLRENAGNITAKREELAKMMYNTVENILKPMADTIRVFPAHGAGSLCGKSLGQESYTTIGNERKNNPAFTMQTEQEFVERLTSGQPFIPNYFTHDVSMNKRGAEEYRASIAHMRTLENVDKNCLIIDARTTEEFAKGHFMKSINIPKGKSFSTWLGTIVRPDEHSIIVANKEDIVSITRQIADIGYESVVQGFVHTAQNETMLQQLPNTDIDESAYTIIDVRSENEVADYRPFTSSINIPLPELRSRVEEIPTDKPILVHCAGGYRSAIATSIIAQSRKNTYDVGERIKNYRS